MGYRKSSRNYASRYTKMLSNKASHPEQLTRSKPLIWHLTLHVKFYVRGRGTEYRPEITSLRLRKWSQTIASLAEQLTRPKPLVVANNQTGSNCPLREDTCQRTPVPSGASPRAPSSSASSSHLLHRLHPEGREGQTTSRQLSAQCAHESSQ